MTLTGFENAPKTMHFAADMPLYFLNHYHGVGLQLVNDQIGLFSHQRLVAQYAYKQSLLGGMLSIGLQGGILSEKFKGSGLDLENSNDPAFSKTDVNGVAIDLSAGLYYTHGPWYAGLSVLHATAPSIELGDRSIIDIARTYAEKVRCIMHPKAVILYGSHAKGTATKDSDIDIAVIVDSIETDYLSAITQLWSLTRSVNDEIEPVLIMDGNDDSGFLKTIQTTGIAV